jgi:hypothetical protein
MEHAGLPNYDSESCVPFGQHVSTLITQNGTSSLDPKFKYDDDEERV